jgi:hypothetical protein
VRRFAMFTFSMNAEKGEVSIETESPGLQSGDAQNLAEKIASSNPRDTNIKIVSISGRASRDVSLDEFFSELGTQLQQRGLKLASTPP